MHFCTLWLPTVSSQPSLSGRPVDFALIKKKTAIGKGNEKKNVYKGKQQAYAPYAVCRRNYFRSHLSGC